MVPTAQRSVNEIVKGMADIFACADIVNGERKLILRSLDGTVDTGCRFKYIEPEIPFSYNDLVEALNKAIDREASETSNKYITNERVTEVIAPTYDYDALMSEFQKITGDLMRENPSNAPKITEIVNKYLGKGKKVSETTREQAEFIDLIIGEIKDTLCK